MLNRIPIYIIHKKRDHNISTLSFIRVKMTLVHLYHIQPQEVKLHLLMNPSLSVPRGRADITLKFSSDILKRQSHWWPQLPQFSSPRKTIFEPPTHTHTVRGSCVFPWTPINGLIAAVTLNTRTDNTQTHMLHTHRLSEWLCTQLTHSRYKHCWGISLFFRHLHLFNLILSLSYLFYCPSPRLPHTPTSVIVSPHCHTHHLPWRLGWVDQW